MMVAGKSTRTYPLTLTRPKPLLPVLNKPLIYYNLDQLIGIVQEVILIVGYRKEMIQSTLGSDYRGMQLTYIDQKEQLGTGHAVLQAAQNVTGKFIVMNGDDLFARNDILQLLDYRFSALVMPVENPNLYGVYQVNNEGLVTDLVEKPKEKIGNLANVGCYLFDESIFDELEKTQPSERNEIELTTAVLNIAKREPFHIISLNEYWLPTGYPWDLLRTQTYFFSNDFDQNIDGHIDSTAQLNGPLQTGIKSIIDQNVSIEGPVYLGSNSIIGHSSQIGPFTSIGNQTKIGTGCQIENSIIMSHSRIGNNCIISNSVLGENVSLENNCILMDTGNNHHTNNNKIKDQVVDASLVSLGVIIGDGVHLSENNRVTSGCKIWPAIQTRKNQLVEKDLIK